MKLFTKKVDKIKKDKKGAVTVIIAAAGSGTRLGGVSKPLIKLCGKYAIEYSLDAFSACSDVTRIIICTKKEDIPAYEKIISEKNYSKVIGVIEGGSTRQKSVALAFRAALGEMITDFVAIHDGARPLITTEETERAIADAKKYGCAVCASVSSDTVKRTDARGFVSESVERNNLYLLGTPQIFSFEIYSASLALAEKSGFEATDDSSLAENAGFRIKLTDTSKNNFKITYPGDAALAELILEGRKSGKI